MSPQILIVDDDDLFRKTLRDMLTQADYRVLEALDGNDAIQKISKRPIDLAIIDIIMPNKEGLQTIREVRKDYPHVKFIAVTGGGNYAFTQYLTMAKKMGAKRTITKPILDQDEFLKEIAAVLSE